MTRGDADGSFERQLEARAETAELGFDLRRGKDGAAGVVVGSDRHVEKSHHRVADVLVDERAAFHQRVGRHS